MATKDHIMTLELKYSYSSYFYRTEEILFSFSVSEILTEIMDKIFHTGYAFTCTSGILHACD